MAEKIRAFKTSEIKPGEIKVFEHNGEAIGICNINGNFHAFLDVCSHMEYPLSTGKLEGEVLTCSAHGARFNVITGEALAMPAVAPIKKFDLTIENGEIFVEID